MSPLISQSEMSAQDTNREAVVFAVLHATFFVTSLAIIPALAPSARIPYPFGPDEASRRFFLENAIAIRWSDLLQLASAACLAALGCMWPRPVSESHRSHRAAHLTVAGSLGSAVFLSLAALTSWSLASPQGVDPGSAFRTLQFLPFLLGGPGWAAFFALFLWGIVGAGAERIPTWMQWSGYVLILTASLATLVLVTLVAAPLLPLTRFLGFLWLIGAATLSMSASRAREVGPEKSASRK